MAAETDDKVQFELEGTMYDIPDVLDLDLDEWIVVYEYAGLVLDDFAPLENAEAEADRVHRLRHPGFMKALAHIGYQRAHPKKTKAAVKDLLGKAKMLPMLESMATEDEEEVPPTSASEPQRSSERKQDGSKGSLYPVSLKSSETPEDQPVPIGISE